MASEIVNALLDGIHYLIEKAINNAPYDKVKNAKITSSHANGAYDVLVDDKTYTLKTLGNSQLNIGDIVKVLIPQNNYSDMFILNTGEGGGGSIDTEPPIQIKELWVGDASTTGVNLDLSDNLDNYPILIMGTGYVGQNNYAISISLAYAGQYIGSQFRGWRDVDIVTGNNGSNRIVLKIISQTRLQTVSVSSSVGVRVIYGVKLKNWWVKEV